MTPDGSLAVEAIECLVSLKTLETASALDTIEAIKILVALQTIDTVQAPLSV